MERILKITIGADWKAAIRSGFTQAMETGSYAGESINFQSPAVFFSRLSDNRWKLLNALQGEGEVGVRELARRLGRDVKRVHEDAAALVDLGLVEKTASGALICPYADIHVDMHLRRAA